MKLYLRDGVWHFRLYFRGREYRRSAFTKSEKQAQRVAEQFQRALILGQYAPEAQDISFEQAAERLVRDYEQQRRRSMRALRARLKHLRWFAGRKLSEISADLISRYVSMRLNQRAKPGTVNREQAALSALFRVAGLLRPKLVRLVEDNVRQGFVEWGDFLRIRGEMPAELQGLVTVLYVTGWRFSSVANLQWRDVDHYAIRVRPEHSKNMHALEFPLNDILSAVLADARADKVVSPYVFHHAGKPWRDIRASWKAACARAGFPRLLVHDLCRSAIRNMMRAPGISEHMAMQLAGRMTRSILYRYDIISHEDRALATKRLNSFLSEQPASKVRKIR